MNSEYEHGDLISENYMLEKFPKINKKVTGIENELSSPVRPKDNIAGHVTQIQGRKNPVLVTQDL